MRNICHEGINQKGSDLQQLQEEEGLQPTGSGLSWAMFSCDAMRDVWFCGAKMELRAICKPIYVAWSVHVWTGTWFFHKCVWSFQERHQRGLHANLHGSLEFLRTTFSIPASSIKPGNMNPS